MSFFFSRYVRAIEAHAGGASGMDAALRVAKVLLADRQPGAAVSFLLRLLEQKLVALEVRLSACLSVYLPTSCVVLVSTLFDSK